MKNCPHCNKILSKPKMNAEIFKKTFKVGDKIHGFSTGKQVRITAIGETRFLYFDEYGKRELVASFNCTQWRKQP